MVAKEEAKRSRRILQIGMPNSLPNTKPLIGR